MIYVVIPTYNEAENIELLTREILSLDLGLNILIVDDNSPDGTGKLVEQIAQKNPQVNVLHNPGKIGLGKAYLEGFKHAWKQGAKVVVTMDADFSHHPRYIPSLLKNVRDYDYVVGSRYAPEGELHYPLFRRVVSFAGVSFARLLLGLKVRDCTGAYRCFNRKVLEVILNNQFSDYADGYIFQIELNYLSQKQGFKIIEVPIIFNDRVKGKSKLSTTKEIYKGIASLLKLRFSR